MILPLLAFLGGVLTILSPCILPVLPFVFARANQRFATSGLPMLVGMAATFALVATLAAVGGGWAVAANQYGRWVALVVLAVLGLTLLLPSLADRLTQPLVRLGGRLSEAADQREGGPSVWSSLILGAATGLLWAPCAGPILGLILTGAAIQGASTATTLLLLCYAAGAATSLALALLIGGKLFAAMKRSLGAGEWIRRGLGVAVLAGVVAIALGADTGVLSRVSYASTNKIEQGLIDKLKPRPSIQNAAAAPGKDAWGEKDDTLPVLGEMPKLDGATLWLNSPPLTREVLRGKAVLVDFWTYSCINCLRSLPYIKAWADRYRDKGLLVIGVHAPEFAFEKDIDNVKRAVASLKVDYPVAIDNDYAIWRAFKNDSWPAHYFVDAQGRIRHTHFGEGDYAESEKIIQTLLEEAGHKDVGSDVVKVNASGDEASADFEKVQSPETYIGYARAERFVSPGGEVGDEAKTYAVPDKLSLNDWGLVGPWTVADENAHLDGAPGKIVFSFHARDLHLVLGPGPDGKPIHFRVTIDGKAPGDDHGVDVAADGTGTVTGQKLYQLVRQTGAIADRTFSIEFEDPGVQAYAFTFG